MTTVIRIEYKDGNGIWHAVDGQKRRVYRSFSFYAAMSVLHEDLPDAHEDGLKRTEDDYFAFSSIPQLYKWIKHSWIKEIVLKGFKIYLLHLSSCKKGKQQVMFRKAHIITKVDITSIFIDK